MKSETDKADDRSQRGCNVNPTFNFTVGGFAITAALLIGYLAYSHWWN